ncbi:MAG: periplasmic heavy metal sensor [Chlorobium sp.]|nr:MAG: periplasmic heavy metal sensor [Chlorobium sp.]
MNFISSKRFVSIALALLVMCNVTLLGVVWWQHIHKLPPFFPQRHHNGQQNPFFVPLGLSEAQNLTFRKLRQEHVVKVRPEMEAINLLKTQLVEESLKDKPDMKTIGELAANIGSHQATIERELALHFHELAEVCVPEQRDSLKKVLERIATHKHFGSMDRSIGPRP